MQSRTEETTPKEKEEEEEEEEEEELAKSEQEIVIKCQYLALLLTGLPHNQI